MSTLPRILGLVAAVLTLGPAMASGHPHVFIDYSIVFVVGARGAESIRMEWTFDEMYSAMLLQRYDTDRNGVLSPGEAKTMHEQHFARLGEDHHFIELKAGGQMVPVRGVRDFQAKAVKGIVTYGFTVPLPSLDAAQGVVEISLTDEEFYVAFSVGPGPTRIDAPPTYQAECAVIGDNEGVRCRYSSAR